MILCDKQSSGFLVISVLTAAVPPSTPVTLFVRLHFEMFYSSKSVLTEKCQRTVLLCNVIAELMKNVLKKGDEKKGLNNLI